MPTTLSGRFCKFLINVTYYRGADKSLARTGRKQANVSFRWGEFPSAPCLAEKKNLKTARVSMLLKSRSSLTCFQACFLPGRAKDLSAPRYNKDTLERQLKYRVQNRSIDGLLLLV